MARYERFTFLVNKDERALIAKLAERLQRTQSDAVRFVVVEAARQLAEQNRAASSAVEASGKPKHARAPTRVPVQVAQTGGSDVA